MLLPSTDVIKSPLHTPAFADVDDVITSVTIGKLCVVDSITNPKVTSSSVYKTSNALEFDDDMVEEDNMGGAELRGDVEVDEESPPPNLWPLLTGFLSPIPIDDLILSNIDMMKKRV